MASVAAYADSLKALQEQAAAYVDSSIRQFLELNPGIDTQTLTDYAAEVLLQSVRVYGDQAAVTACEQYNETVRAAGIKADAADILNEYESYQACSRAYSAAAESGGEVSRFLDIMKSAAYDKVLQAANKTVGANADRDYSKGVRWARVPSGRETCGFCVMLSSRGFVYKSAETAGYTGGLYNRYHDHCDCVAVAGTEGTVVDGYDPDALYAVYKDARETLYGAGSTHGKADTDAICREINRRATSWAWGRSDSGTVDSKGQTWTASVASAADALASHGFRVDASSAKGYDLTINHRSWSVQDVAGSVSDALSQSRAIAATATILNMGAAQTAGAVAEIRAAMQTGETVLAIFTDGSIRRFS